jgi:hypothetical protein
MKLSILSEIHTPSEGNGVLCGPLPSDELPYWTSYIIHRTSVNPTVQSSSFLSSDDHNGQKL